MRWRKKSTSTRATSSGWSRAWRTFCRWTKRTVPSSRRWLRCLKITDVTSVCPVKCGWPISSPRRRNVSSFVPPSVTKIVRLRFTSNSSHPKKKNHFIVIMFMYPSKVVIQLRISQVAIEVMNETVCNVRKWCEFRCFRWECLERRTSTTPRCRDRCWKTASSTRCLFSTWRCRPTLDARLRRKRRPVSTWPSAPRLCASTRTSCFNVRTGSLW